MFSKKLDEVYSALKIKFYELNHSTICEKIGFIYEKDTIKLDWFNQKFIISVNDADIKTVDGNNVNLKEKVMILHHMCSVNLTAYHSEVWNSLGDLKQANLLASSSNQRVVEPLAKLFSGKLDAFKSACEKLGGIKVDAADASYIIQILPEINAKLVFYDKDEDFDASLAVFFESTVEMWTHPGDIAVLVEIIMGYLKDILEKNENNIYGIDKSTNKIKVTILYVSETENTAMAAEYIENGLKKKSDIIDVQRMNISYDEGYDESYIKDSKAVIFGSPVYHANMQWKLKRWFDVNIKVKLSGKLGCAFATENSVTGGAEIAILTILQHMITKGMMVYSPPCAHIGAIGIGQRIEQHEAEFTKYGEQFADKVIEIFGK